LGAKNLAAGQKGIALASVLKVISPILLNIPGLIALHMYSNLENTTEVYPRLIGDVMPQYLTGFMAAIIFGAALTTFNSGLNSSSTLFMLNIYKPHLEKRKKEINDAKLILKSKYLQVFLAMTAMFIAPFIAFVDGGFFDYIQKVAGFFSVPIFTILFVGFVTKRVPPIGAKVALIYFIVCYAITQLFVDTGLHFLHIMAILFVTSVGIMLLFGKLYPMKVPYKAVDKKLVNTTPWKYRHIVSVILVLIVIAAYILFSPLGIAT